MILTENFCRYYWPFDIFREPSFHGTPTAAPR